MPPLALGWPLTTTSGAAPFNGPSIMNASRRWRRWAGNVMRLTEYGEEFAGLVAELLGLDNEVLLHFF